MHTAAPGPVDLPLTDLSSHADPASAARRALLDTDARTPFDLVSGPVARAQLVRLAADQHVLIFTAHHIVCDGWSINIIVGELGTAYSALCRGAAPQLPPALQFSTYARAQAQLDPAQLAATESYWLRLFREPVRALELPTDRPRPALRSYSGASRCRRIDAALYRAIKQGGARSGITLFVTLLGAFQALIGRLCDQSEVVVGVPTAGQSLLDEDILVGHCVNFLPIRARWHDTTAIGEHLRAVARQVLDASEHSSYTLGTLVRKLAVVRESNRMPLTEIQFNLERLAARLELPGTDGRGRAQQQGARGLRPVPQRHRIRRGLAARLRLQHRPVRRRHHRSVARVLSGAARAAVQRCGTSGVAARVPAARRARAGTVRVQPHAPPTSRASAACTSWWRHVPPRSRRRWRCSAAPSLSAMPTSSDAPISWQRCCSRVSARPPPPGAASRSASSARSTCWWRCWRYSRPAAPTCRSSRHIRPRGCATS